MDAVRFLYVRFKDNVYGYVLSIVREPHEAEDVTQQVFMKLMSSISKYEPRAVPFTAWILRVARNVAIDHLRQRPTRYVRRGARALPTRATTPTATAAVGLEIRARNSARRPARRGGAAPHRGANARRDRRADGAERIVDPRPTSPWPAGPQARADRGRLRSGQRGLAAARRGQASPRRCDRAACAMPASSG